MNNRFGHGRTLARLLVAVLATVWSLPACEDQQGTQTTVSARMLSAAPLPSATTQISGGSNTLQASDVPVGSSGLELLVSTNPCGPNQVQQFFAVINHGSTAGGRDWQGKVYGDIVANTVEVVSEGTKDSGASDDGEPPHNTDDLPF